jgi:hypothetical protein
MIGAGNFGGKRMSDNTSIKPIVEPPKRAPDATVYEQTSVNQVIILQILIVQLFLNFIIKGRTLPSLWR